MWDSGEGPPWAGPSPPSPLPLVFYPFLACAQPWASLPGEQVLCLSGGPFTCSAHQGLQSRGAAPPTAGTSAPLLPSPWGWREEVLSPHSGEGGGREGDTFSINASSDLTALATGIPPPKDPQFCLTPSHLFPT